MKDRNIYVRIPEKVKNSFVKELKKRGYSINGAIKIAIEKLMKKWETEKEAENGD